MKLYGTSLSPFVRKVLVVLAEKGIEVRHVPLRFHDPDPRFRAASPFGKIPALEDGDFLLADSSAIIQYLERKHPEPAVLPRDARDLGRTVWYDELGDTELFPLLIKPFVQRVLRPQLMKLPCDEAVVGQCMAEELPRPFDYLEGVIDGPYLVGGAFTLADISVVTAFHNLHLAGEAVEAGRWPRLAAYVAGILERPSFKAALAARQG
ncbi:glutathione S-transferase family protein [Methylobacterium nonmethylotrophicum]|uniref:Glutathione S-transferase family protein n=1 Tax=Methylobacterium nonmethylotrophicum TaxID=1141884 RepID=A0A4Z0NFC6_9HYPH|nr:glutathione S-transferase family protein [Methylobacterium nonmethylotrophicum]TGD95003.1 glutathione S-transferase family protein [Methylobacterium nonmethylotrophicum]